jgi:hypothetical protein
MHSFDIIGYVEDGCIICTDCFIGDDTDDETSPIFVDNGEETIGSTCDTCQSFLGPDLAWHPLEDATVYRWPGCKRCNPRSPTTTTPIHDSGAPQRLECPSCRTGRMHF